MKSSSRYCRTERRSTHICVVHRCRTSVVTLDDTVSHLKRLFAFCTKTISGSIVGERVDWIWYRLIVATYDADDGLLVSAEKVHRLLTHKLPIFNHIPNIWTCSTHYCHNQYFTHQNAQKKKIWKHSKDGILFLSASLSSELNLCWMRIHGLS